jgi:hypothetical protein
MTWMIAKHLRETIEGDAAGRMVHVMHPDIVSEPSQGRRQCIVGASVESRFVKAPIVTMSPKRAFELMLDIKEPDGNRGAYDHYGSLHNKKRADSHQPDKQRDDAGDRRVGPHGAQPRLPTQPHHADRKTIMQHEEVSQNQSEHDERVAVEPIEKALNGCLRELFICRQGDDVAAASMIEIAGVGVM